jgi:FkbM family methyltransferase
MIFHIGDKVHRNVLLSCDHGLMIVNRFDCNHEQVGHGQWLLDHGNTSTIEAAHCFGAIRHLANPVIFDIGANIGTFTTWMARAFPNGKIHAFEPQRAIFQMLNGNAAINNLYNVYTHNIALGQENKKIRFQEPNYFEKNDYGTFSLVEDIISQKTNNVITVESKTLDSFVEYHDIENIDLLKIDTEGMDVDILSGGVETIKKCLPVIFIEHSDNRRSVIDEIQTFLDQFQYLYQIIGNNVLCQPSNPTRGHI